MSDYASTEYDRMIANMIAVGQIAEVGQGVVKVVLGGLKTDWIQWCTQRAGDDRDWWAPSIGEQCILAAPSGDLSQAVIIGFLFQDQYPAPADSGDVRRTVYQDGTIVEYDKAASCLKIDASKSSGTVQIICQQASIEATNNITFDTPKAEFTGNVTIAKSLNAGANGGGKATFGSSIDFQGDSVSHKGKEIGHNHKHDQVTPGGGESGGVV